MFQPFPGEKFKKVQLEKTRQLNYAISNFGRLVSYQKRISEGRLVNGSNYDGYRSLGYKAPGKNSIHKRHLFYKLVAKYFVKRPSAAARYIIHLDHVKTNDFANNLRWVTRSEFIAHNMKSPARLKLLKRLRSGQIDPAHNKLTRVKVLALKKQIANPRRRTTLRQLAAQYGISEMQLYRIKRGENWGHLRA